MSQNDSPRRITIAEMAPHVHSFKMGENKVTKISDWLRAWINSALQSGKIKPLDLLLTLMLAGGLFFLFFGLVQLDYALFHQDFRFMLLSASPLSRRFLLTWLGYFPIMFVFYLSNSIKVFIAGLVISGLVK